MLRNAATLVIVSAVLPEHASGDFPWSASTNKNTSTATNTSTHTCAYRYPYALTSHTHKSKCERAKDNDKYKELKSYNERKAKAKACTKVKSFDKEYERHFAMFEKWRVKCKLELSTLKQDNILVWFEDMLESGYKVSSIQTYYSGMKSCVRYYNNIEMDSWKLQQK